MRQEFGKVMLENRVPNRLDLDHSTTICSHFPENCLLLFLFFERIQIKEVHSDILLDPSIVLDGSLQGVGEISQLSLKVACCQQKNVKIW